MERRRNSTASNAKPRRNLAAKVSHLQIDHSGPSFSDLPNNILVTILLRLSIKRIFVCKCVCKTWHDLISDPEFAKLHCNQAQVYPLLRTPVYTKLSCMLYLVQPEQDDFERKLDMCYDSSPIKIKLDSIFKLPLRNVELILDKEGVEGENFKKLNMRNHNYKIVNSCNGLLCLSNPSDNEPVIVCNPVTGEFINLPEVRTISNYPISSSTNCGFGFSPATNQYKVIRMFTCWIGLPKYDEVIVAEVHILGTETWRVLPCLPKSTYGSFPTYLDGCIYWFSDDKSYSVVSFDIEKECFESILVPPLDNDASSYEDRYLSMGVLGGELFISDNSRFRYICFWAMKDNGGKKSWSQIFSFQKDGVEKWPFGTYQPIKYLNNGALLMFNSWGGALISICMDPGKTGFRYLKIRGFYSEVEAIAHIPSFVPLKHALSGHNVKVLNVKSRCAELNLHGETKDISIVEEDGNSVIDPYDMDQVFDYEDIDQESDFEY